MNTTTAETGTRTELAGNVRDLRRVTLAEIIRARTARCASADAGEFNSSI